MKYIIKISPEITIKSKAVRKRCSLLLQNNIKKHLNFNEVKSEVIWTWDRLIIESDDKKTENILSKVPWIAHFMEVESFDLPENPDEIFDFIFKKTLEFYADKVVWKTFVVRVRRSWKHDFSSIDLERYIWGWILKHVEKSSVKIKNPEITVKLELKDNTLNVIKYRVNWVSWYPVWFQDRVLSLISWWFDSWVSTYSMMKRWCDVDYLFFNLWGSAHELWVKQVSYYLWKNFSVPHKRARFITVNFEEVISELLIKVNHKFRWVLLKRFMLKVASMISENRYYAIVKGDSLWQVSSQTLKNMHVIDKASTNLVLRPLISNNKQEIVDVSKEIWTYNFACNMPEYCWVISDKPSTWAKLEDILKEEEIISEDIFIRAIENRKIEFVKDMMDQYKWRGESELEVCFLPWDDEVVIDIREESEKKKNKLSLEWIPIIEIPFFKINHEFEKLNQDKSYLFYCEKGVLSNLHWLYLKEKWFENIKILRPLKSSWPCKV